MTLLGASPLLKSQHPLPEASTARSAAFWPQVGVVGIKGMAPFAVGLPKLPGGWRNSTTNILRSGDRFEVVWPYTLSVAAEVIEFHAIGDRAIDRLENVAVDHDHPMGFEVRDLTIPVCSEHADPFPAARLANDVAERVALSVTAICVELDKDADHRVKYSN